MNYLYAVIFYLTFLVIDPALSVKADPIYRTTDKKGVTVYTSKPVESGSSPVALPSIVKAPIGVSKPNGSTCVGHGGVNCQLGADTDGSVICYDDFRGSLQRFVFSCSAAKLTILPESEKRGLSGLSLLIRNTSAVAAKGVKVIGPNSLILEGPNEIPPYDSASYSTKQELSRNTRFQVTCDNCP